MNKPMLAIVFLSGLMLLIMESCATAGEDSNIEVKVRNAENVEVKTTKSTNETGKLIADWCSEDKEILFGNYVDAYILQNFILLEDESIIKNIKRIGEKVARASTRPHLQYHFKVLNSNDANAFAGPGGYVYITTGLLRELDSEAEVAAILAHEIGHVCERHAIRKLQNDQNTKIFGNLLSIGAVVVVGALTSQDTSVPSQDLANAAGAAAYVATMVVSKGYGQSYEIKADEEGAKFLIASGYEGSGAVSALDKLLQVENNREENVNFTFLSTHPSTKYRISKIKEFLNRPLTDQ